MQDLQEYVYISFIWLMQKKFLHFAQQQVHLPCQRQLPLIDLLFLPALL